VCGDSVDLIDGQPTGSVRISFGFSSTVDDALTFIRFIKECFIEASTDNQGKLLRQHAADGNSTVQQSHESDSSASVTLVGVRVYPVKSCAAVEVCIQSPF
jgi:molybdenum cofactor sulfurtransferase